MKPSKARIISYMNKVKHEHVDQLTGEINCTGLAEDAIDNFDIPENTELYENVFDYAVNVADAHER